MQLSGDKNSGLVVKIYVVVQRVVLAKGDEANRKIITAKLTRTAAQIIVDKHPGSYIEKLSADKTVLV